MPLYGVKFYLPACLNGGSHDGTKCICRDNLFYGPKCEFPVEDIPLKVETVPVTVEANVKITNKNLTSALKNKSSEEYKILEKDFKKEMNFFYKDVPGYRDVEILNLMSGSIIVNHKVIIEAIINNNINNIDEVLQTVTEAVWQSAVAINSSQENCTRDNATFCFSAKPEDFGNAATNFSAEELCKATIGHQYSAYYYANTTTGILQCMSNCSKDSSFAINCYYGVCQLSESGPQCNCNDMDAFWYTSSHCQTRIQKKDFGLAFALAAVVLISTILAIFLFRAKRRKSASTSESDKDAIWCEDDEEATWVPPGGISIINEAAWDGKNSF
uniref:SEA domain-containing protein n=1 Tax=Anolis carolinensis TaxID=28377 RepID=R4GAP0_ANOCA